MEETVSLAYLIAPLAVGDFFENHWEKKILHLRHQAGYFNNVLRLSDIDDLLSQQNLLPDGIKLMNSGEGIDVHHWTKAEKLLDGTIKTVVDTQKLFKYFNSGATIIINAAEKCITRLANACRNFEQEMQIRVQANIYVTPPNSQGFAMHYDPHDIFLMQIKGPKTWQIYDSGEQLPTKYRKFRQEAKLVLKQDILTGDFMYMPRGTVHEAFASDVSTVHVNFSCKPRYGYHLIEDIAGLAEQDDIFFRQTIPHGYSSDEEKKAYMEAFHLKLEELVKKVSPVQLLAMETDDFVAQHSMDFKGYLLNALQMETLTIQSKVSKRKGCIYTVKKAGNTLHINFSGQKLIVPPFIDKTLFLQDEPFTIADIKGLATADGKLTLVKEFIAAGFLEIIDEHL